MTLYELNQKQIEIIGFDPYDKHECFKAVEKDGWNFRFVKEQTEEICLAAVKKDRWNLRFVKNQTPEICLAAVERDGYTLQFVKEQTEEICLAAIKQNGYALQFVKEQTPEMCKEAVKQDKKLIQFVKDLNMLVEEEMMDFGAAIKVLKEGKKVSRKGWNGKNMFLYYVPDNKYTAMTNAAKSIADKQNKVDYEAYIAMKTAQGNVVPWLASQTDVLSEDWIIV